MIIIPPSKSSTWIIDTERCPRSESSKSTTWNGSLLGATFEGGTVPDIAARQKIVLPSMSTVISCVTSCFKHPMFTVALKLKKFKTNIGKLSDYFVYPLANIQCRMLLLILLLGSKKIAELWHLTC